jgi:hypothetical protein
MRTLEVPDEVFETAQKLADKRGVSVAELVESALKSEADRSSHRAPLAFKPIPKERVGWIRNLTNEEIDRIVHDEEDPT